MDMVEEVEQFQLRNTFNAVFFGQNYPSSQHILRKSLWNPTTNYNWKSDSQINAEQMLVQNETTKSEIKKKNWEEGTNESKH